MVRSELGSTWVVLCTLAGFQLFQSLLCEKRKLEDETRDKREGRGDPLNRYPKKLARMCWVPRIALDDHPALGIAKPAQFPDRADCVEVDDLL